MIHAIEAVIEKSSVRRIGSMNTLVGFAIVALLTLDLVFTGGEAIVVCIDVAIGIGKGVTLFGVAAFVLFFYLMLINWSCALASAPFGSPTKNMESNLNSLIRPFVESGVLPRVLLYDMSNCVSIGNRISPLLRSARVRIAFNVSLPSLSSFLETLSNTVRPLTSSWIKVYSTSFGIVAKIAGSISGFFASAAPQFVGFNQKVASRALAPVALTIATFICVCSQMVVRHSEVLPPSRSTRTYGSVATVQLHGRNDGDGEFERSTGLSDWVQPTRFAGTDKDARIG
jgi:hypothetical protein